MGLSQTGATAGTRCANHLSLLHNLSHFDLDTTKLGISGLQTLPMVNHNQLTIRSLISSEGNSPIANCQNLSAHRGG
jgi:hypothetical protein